jgi:hypothetical protein
VTITAIGMVTTTAIGTVIGTVTTMGVLEGHMSVIAATFLAN